MSKSVEAVHCVNCGRSDAEVPLVVLRYAGDPQWICSSCLPVLIHRADQLVGKLRDAENIPPSQHED
jgi:hypothetical protein